MNEEITIKKTANGYAVFPCSMPGDVIETGRVFVFQRKGYASGAGDYGPKSLLEFIDEHFTDTSEQPPLA
jgi:hypothetical protein